MSRAQPPGPRLSVILPVYNGAALLEQAAASVLAQPCRDLELLLVDDGSTDATPALCRDLERRDSRVRYLFQANTGAASARNHGLAAAQGTYAAFLDHDDLWLPGFYTAQLAQSLQTGPDVLVFGYCMADQKLRRCARRAIHTHEANGPQALREPWGHHGAMLFRRGHLLGQDIQYPDLRFSEDVQFCMKALCAAETVRFDSRLMLVYRQRPGSVTKTPILARAHYLPILESWYGQRDWVAAHARDPSAALRFWADVMVSCTLGYLQTACGQGQRLRELRSLPRLPEYLALRQGCVAISDAALLDGFTAHPHRFWLHYRLKAPFTALRRRAYGFGPWRYLEDRLVFTDPLPANADA